MIIEYYAIGLLIVACSYMFWEMNKLSEVVKTLCKISSIDETVIKGLALDLNDYKNDVITCRVEIANIKERMNENNI
ncbi:hypothetical protein OGA32_000096 [Salmonella enterica]|nr:hypothetical protein [Salmonella enterica]